jgi:hypothetical protein
MKRYLANKDFIPSSFIESKRKNENKGDRRGLMFLTIIALILLPYVFGNLFSKEEKEHVIEADLNSQYISLNKWLDFIDENLEGKFSREGSYVIIEGSENIKTLLEKENISVDSMEELGEKKYKLQISQK